ncbi:BNR repeat-containing protein [Lunatimonas salinarum]|uniref:BNR repeat-containing protein n=1 Tax=Lunatimonas salinarum TaxID=1774590 RepID=UPI001FD7CD52|nr:BNR repeat-containing protein [Lunatimonas salinarum]
MKELLNCVRHAVGCLGMILLAGSLFLSCQKEQSWQVIDERDQQKAVVDRIFIDSVWAGHPVGFSLLTSGDRQYIAYYDRNRYMTVGQRKLTDPTFSLHTLPVFDREAGEGTSTILNWDSHNSVTIGIDKEGYLHLSGNMHVHPITYFRSEVAYDISTLVQHKSMVGSNEQRCTYPHFMTNREGELLFHYRDGGSGNGNEIYNIYDTQTKTWSRLLDTPLTDGQGLMNAYASQPKLMEDNWYHMYWVWRDTPDCETNHDLSYIKSPDLTNWFDALGNPVTLPVTFDQKSVIVAPIPARGGIINLAAKLLLDENLSPVMAFHKYDEEGNLQFYTTWLEGDAWQSKQVTDWDYRWEFSGRGSIVFEVRLGDFRRRADGNYELGYDHIKYGEGTMLLDKDFNRIGEVHKPVSWMEETSVEGNFPGLQIRSSSDLGQPSERKQYLLKWETLPQNRDRPHPEPWPGPSALYVYVLE